MERALQRTVSTQCRASRLGGEGGLIGALVAVAILALACARPHAQPIVLQSDVAESHGLRVRAARLEKTIGGSGGGRTKYLVPVLVELRNDGHEPVRIRLNDLSLVDGRGGDRSPVRVFLGPARLPFQTSSTPLLSRAATKQVHVIEGQRVWAFPSLQMRRDRLKEGVLEPEEKVVGFVYFASDVARPKRRSLRWDAHSSEGEPLGATSSGVGTFSLEVKSSSDDEDSAEPEDSGSD